MSSCRENNLIKSHSRHLLAVLLLSAALLPITARAQETSAFPTVDALNSAVVPPRNLTDLSKRLSGTGAIPPPPVNPPALEVGTIDTFWVDNSSEDRTFEIEAELVVMGDHIYLWVESGQSVPLDGLQQLADDFDTLVYDQVRGLWGSEASPGVDGDPRVHGLFARDVGRGIAAYFASKHAYPVEAVPTSNNREMFVYNLDAIEGSIGDFSLTSITAHEFQHMIRANVDSNEDGWMDEGFSEFTQIYLGDNNIFPAFAFQAAPNTQLNTWTDVGDRTPDYGASQMWVTFLYERFGEEGLLALSADPANGMKGVDNLARQHDTTADELFADWVAANLILDADVGLGYSRIAGLAGPSLIPHVAPPVTETRTINQYAAQYISIGGVAGQDYLTLNVTLPEAVGLADMESPTGTPMWYSNRGDDSNTRLTLPLDLTDTTNPTLAYTLWYRIEEFWDYGYAMVSTDDGATWDILAAPSTTPENPHFAAFGPGYTGLSGGGINNAEWVQERVSLADYAGQPVLLRFEMIYDDAVNQPGLFIDSVSVTDGDQTIYASDFSSAADEWQAEGWVLTDNRLPQKLWLQVFQRVNQQVEAIELSRWLVEGGGGEYSVRVVQDVNNVVVILSPFAPTTTVPAEVTLNVTGVTCQNLLDCDN